MNINNQHRSAAVKQMATALGFDACGIAAAVPLDDDARRLEKWLKNGFQGGMDYMSNHFDLRTDPTKLVPGANSVITLAYNYFPKVIQDPSSPKIAKYAYGKDYHLVIRKKLNAFLVALQTEFGNIEGRGFVDSAPVLERSWAVRSGIGWIGKNGNLIMKKNGSFFFLATLITDLKLEPDPSFKSDHCGNCTRCVDACPTDAILPNKEINGSQCISYFTIELKAAELPQELKQKADNWVFGCDICQDVCPWNRFSVPHNHEEIKPLDNILHFSIGDWMQLNKESFNDIFRHSPLKRTKWEGMKRNLRLYTPIGPEING